MNYVAERIQGEVLIWFLKGIAMLKNGSSWLASVSLCLLVCNIARSEDKVSFPFGWNSESPRQEIRPEFSYAPHGGPNGTGAFVISHDHREGLDGWMQKSFDVSGGDFVHFQALRKLSKVDLPRRSALVRVLWQAENGRMVSADIPETQAQKLGHVPTAEPEHPVDGPTNADGWTTVHGIYRVPKKATKAIVELHLQWAPNGSVQWSEIEFVKNLPPLPRNVRFPRNVRLASVHFKPTGTTARENCEQFAPFITQAAQSKADLIVLGETVPSASPNMNRQQVAETAELIPGPSTDYFGKIAKEHHTHIVLSLYERDRHLIYNTAVLMGPNGQLIGESNESTQN